ncbi:PAS domain-containing protein [Rhodoferax sp. WC2427]|uniref:PAS domain-containing protein n=1 Tax=Rhodoferax sp. WC2427 TaxID=3234144 RepID=UPI003466A045
MDKYHAAMALRLQAEAIIRDKVALSNRPPETLTLAGMQRAMHELQVHQIELEMQNDELQRTQLLLETSRSRYFELYDMAPVGYCTVSEGGLVVEANLAVAALLGIARGTLVGQRISRFIGKDYQDTYYRLRKQLLETGTPKTCELQVVSLEGHPCWVQLTISAAHDATGAPEQHLVLADISESKVMAAAMQASEARYRALVDGSPEATTERKRQDGAKEAGLQD